VYEHHYLLSDFDFDLPERLLAVEPLAHRDESRLMLVHKNSGLIEHRMFKDLPFILHRGDCMVFNDTKVIPARLQVRKSSITAGALLDVLLISPVVDRPNTWAMLLDPLRKVKVGTPLIFGDNSLRGHIVKLKGEKEVWVEFSRNIEPEALKRQLFALGAAPLPPYLKKAWANVSLERYQTVYAKQEGALAAPTAGLHFTETMFESLAQAGIGRSSLTLHVGLGTFDPLYHENFKDSKLHKEWFELDAATASNIDATVNLGATVVAVGTTTMRALESSVGISGRVEAGSGYTDIFIQPGYQFQSAHGLFTNFHTPRSTLLIMIAAFMGYDLMREAYAKAIEEEYRFYSFGDAMLIIP